MSGSDYGHNQNSNQGMMYLPGSPDARAHGGDMYDQMKPISGYGKKVTTQKNKSGMGAPNSGIQGDAKSQTGDKSAAVSGSGKSYKSDYKSMRS